MSRPRMWMQVGTWPPPSDAGPKSGHVQRRPLEEAGVRRWVVMRVVSAAVLGATAGSLATMLIGQVCV